MNKIKNFFADWSWKEKAWLAFVLIVQTVAWGIQKESAFMLIMTLTSSLNLVLGAKGKVAGLYFCDHQQRTVCDQLYGDPAVRRGYVQLDLLDSGKCDCNLHMEEEHDQGWRGQIPYHDTKDHGYNSSGNARWCVRLHADPEVDGWKSSIHGFSATVVSVVASFLYLLRFSEQWAMWAIVNVLSIVMWIMVFIAG